MTTETSPLNRQPTALDYSSPTQFRFLINQLPKVQYFTTEANVPGMTLSEGQFNTPLKDIELLGDKLTYEDLTIKFIVDENLENYIEMHTWLTGIGFPKDRKQFSEFRSVTSNMSTTTRGESKDIGDVRASTPELAMTSDAVMTILTNKNNPVVECRFKDVFPVSLSGLTYSQNQTDVDYLTADVSFKYTIYEIVTL
mgnify:FL=1|jgi:hypothetical protein|tara:strand:+ start:394 stop:984 length:591 start_codon:yes stop_codon:yes gene_type:complete